MTELHLFYALGTLAVVSALSTVALARSVLSAALCLGSTMLSLAGLFALLGAPMLAVAHVIVGAGSVMLLVAFLMTLLEAGGGASALAKRTPTRSALKAAGAVAALTLAVLLGRVLRLRGMPEAEAAEFVGGHARLGLALFGDFVVATEIMGLVLFSALIAAAVLVRERPTGSTRQAAPGAVDAQSEGSAE